MATLPHDDLLALWETAQPLDPVRRAAALASGVSGRDGGSLPLGARDAHLLELVADLDGRVLDAVAACPSCSEPVELDVGVDELLEAGARAHPPSVVSVGDHTVEVRCLDSNDVAAAGATGDAGAAERVLLERCVVHAVGPSGAAAPEALPDPVRTAIASALSDADPLAEVLVDVTCPACGLAYAADIDVASHAWRAVQARARALLADIDVLARAYGWTETEILALSDARRATYVGLATGGTG